MTMKETSWKDLKLTAQGRSALREAIRRNPHAVHTHSSSEISRLRKIQLLNLAASLGIDIDAVLAKTRHTPPASSQEYPFEGTVEFDMTMALLGRHVTRKVAIHYEYSPSWSHFDTASGKEEPGEDAWTMDCRIQAEFGPNVSHSEFVAGRRVSFKLKTRWEPCNDITALGVWSDEMWDDIYALMDKQAHEQDALNRRQAKAPKAL